MQDPQPRLWWEREDLQYRDDRLHLGSECLLHMAASAGTPSFVYNSPRVLHKLETLQAALEQQGVRHGIYYALKANRFAPLLTALRLRSNCGIDVCSPNELRLARQTGFPEHKISYTGTSISNRDLDVIAAHPDVLINCDSLSSIRRLGERCPGRHIGLRVNPQLSASYLEHISYGGETATKFGIYPDRFKEALALAAQYQLQLTTLHFHSASGYLDGELALFERILDQLHQFLEQAPSVRTVDIGGGLGVPLVAADKPLDLARWAGLLAKFAASRDLEIQVEPGDYLVKDAGVLLVEVNYVEEKGGTLFVGVDAGFNLSNLHAVYDYPLIIAPVRRSANAPLRTVTIAGNINEGVDTLAENVELPQLAEGDYIALMNLGGYSSSNSSNHCMRGDFSEYLLP